MEHKKQMKLTREIEAGYSYLLYQPKEHKNEKLPLIIFLHGAGERGEDLSQLKAHSIPNMFAQEVAYPCVVVSPQCPADSFWTAQIMQLKLFIEEIVRTYDIDENRICLTGVSMGGYGTWHMAMAYPQMFASIVPVCGGGMPWNAEVLTMPVWAFHGEADTVVDVRESISIMEKLRQVNSRAKLTLLPNVDHNAWDYAYNDALISWILEQKK